MGSKLKAKINKNYINKNKPMLNLIDNYKITLSKQSFKLIQQHKQIQAKILLGNPVVTINQKILETIVWNWIVKLRKISILTKVHCNFKMSHIKILCKIKVLFSIIINPKFKILILKILFNKTLLMIIFSTKTLTLYYFKMKFKQLFFLLKLN